ncbi:hypothetical protein BKA69DRAFT_517832 [Paraphysoderma sedebokerense]|nr:hypothetical protein BKA69DRAFT_517832 [Paraphysoderma sedebokerense]
MSAKVSIRIPQTPQTPSRNSPSRQLESCPFPECLNCILKLPEPHRKIKLSKELSELPNRDESLIEFWTTQCRSLLRYISALPSSHSTSLSSPTTTSIKSPTSPPSPNTQTKQTEIDYLFECGLAECMIKIAQKEIPYSPDYALIVLCGLLTNSVRPEICETMVKQNNLLNVLVSLLKTTKISTVIGYTFDLISALFGTTGVGRDLGNRQVVIELVQVVLSTAKSVDTQQFIQQVTDIEYFSVYQADILGVGKKDVKDYAPRWIEILQNKAMLALCTLVKTRFDMPELLLDLAKIPEFLSFVCDAISKSLPASYPESDKSLLASVLIAVLAQSRNSEISSLLIKSGILDTLSSSIQLLTTENPEDIIELFCNVDEYLPPEFAQEDLESAADTALTNRAQQLSLIAHSIYHISRSIQLPNNIITQLKNLFDMCVNTSTVVESSPSKAILQTHMRDISVSKGTRIGRKYLRGISSPPTIDSIILTLFNSTSNNTLTINPTLTTFIQSRISDNKSNAKEEFHRKQYRNAIDSYSVAIELSHIIRDSNFGYLYSARAECYLQVKEFENAKTDAKCALDCESCKSDQKLKEKSERRLARAEEGLKLGSK